MMIAMKTSYSDYASIPVGRFLIDDRWIKKIDGNPIEVEVLDYTAYLNGIQLPHATMRTSQTGKSSWNIVNHDNLIYANVTILCDTDVEDEDFFQYSVYGMCRDDPQLDYVVVTRILEPAKDQSFL